MFGANGKKVNYDPVALDEFSDDDSDHEDLTPPSRSSSAHNSLHGAGGSIISSNSNGMNGNGNYNHADSSPTSTSASYASQSMGRQHELLRKQDQGLEMLSQSAERLGAMSLQINDEIGFQNQMLDEMETDLERADEDLDMVTRQTKKFIEQAGGTKNCIIIVTLALVVVVLLILLIYL